MKAKRVFSLSTVLMLMISMVMIGVNVASASSTANVYCDPDPKTVVGNSPGEHLGTTFVIEVWVENVTGLYGWDVRLNYNSTLLNMTSATQYGTNAAVGSEPHSWTDVSVAGSARVGVAFSEAGGAVAFDGDGVLVFLTFEIMYVPAQLTAPPPYNEVNCSLAFDSTFTNLYPVSGPNIPRTLDDGFYEYEMMSVVPGAPTADFTYSPGVVFVCNDVVCTDNSVPGPDGSWITTYAWTLTDVTGSAHWITADGSASRTFHCDGVGTVDVSLTVTNNFGLSDTITKRIDQLETLVAILDLWTSENRFCGQTTTYTGKGLYEPADALSPDVNVTLYAGVAWGGAPVAHVLVAFEVFDNSSGTPVNVLTRTAETDKYGVAKIWFRVPRMNPVEQIFGEWFAYAKAKIQDEFIEDLMPFKVGYLVTIDDWLFSPSVVIRGEGYIDVTVWLKNIFMMEPGKEFVLTVTLYDDCDVPIGKVFVEGIANPEAPYCTPGITEVTLPSIPIPDYAYVGVGKIYISVFTDWPMNCGVAYSPEVSGVFQITWEGILWDP